MYKVLAVTEEGIILRVFDPKEKEALRKYLEYLNFADPRPDYKIKEYYIK